ncbi:expressed unknown protein [Seminavis robusta]|uniref:Uncharacterized protein n=1 Tax=Seminavis robusta TaxID=568900 RepID=A0A9N8DUL7_9STRA|nr:expressed unknown protein [Seminavis robusta]|eukprot:Sro384_g131370.1 n/a (139) ;mRNA; f:5135-5862
MVSVGTPENCKKLIDHLGVPNGAKYLFVDPENSIYDALYLNRGVKETFFSVSTPFAFLDRFTKKDGTKDLLEVLLKWNKGLYIPPRLEQGLLQGGTFVFDGPKTLFAHYDESTAAHASLEEVIPLACNAVKKQELALN